jgi:tetratricopeptide (TPR) repeat protein
VQAVVIAEFRISSDLILQTSGDDRRLRNCQRFHDRTKGSGEGRAYFEKVAFVLSIGGTVGYSLTAGVFMNLICVAIFWAAAVAQAPAAPTQDAVDRAFHQMYNTDFAGAQATLAEEIRKNPENPILYSLRAAALLFSELSRMKILELDFFIDDDRLTDRKRIKPDPAIRGDFFQATRKARELASARVAADPQDPKAVFAMFMAAGVETDYTLLIEKKYIRSYSLTKETQNWARKALAMNPPLYDAYLSLGMMEYVVGNLNFFYKLFVNLDQIQGNKKKAVEYLNLVIEHGRYYPPYAKILLSVIYLRDKKPERALALLKELERDFPANQMIHEEVRRVSAKIGQTGNRNR